MNYKNIFAAISTDHSAKTKREAQLQATNLQLLLC